MTTRDDTVKVPRPVFDAITEILNEVVIVWAEQGQHAIWRAEGSPENDLQHLIAAVCDWLKWTIDGDQERGIPARAGTNSNERRV